MYAFKMWIATKLETQMWCQWFGQVISLYRLGFLSYKIKGFDYKIFKIQHQNILDL